MSDMTTKTGKPRDGWTFVRHTARGSTVCTSLYCPDCHAHAEREIASFDARAARLRFERQHVERNVTVEPFEECTQCEFMLGVAPDFLEGLHL